MPHRSLVRLVAASGVLFGAALGIARAFADDDPLDKMKKQVDEYTKCAKPCYDTYDKCVKGCPAEATAAAFHCQESCGSAQRSCIDGCAPK